MELVPVVVRLEGLQQRLLVPAVLLYRSVLRGDSHRRCGKALPQMRKRAVEIYEKVVCTVICGRTQRNKRTAQTNGKNR